MPSIPVRNVFAGAGTIPNVFSGSQYEFAPFDGTIEVGLTVTVVGAATFSCLAGPDTLVESNGMIPFYGTEQAPKYPDDYHVEDEVAMGDRLKIGLVATAACIVNTVLRITPS